MWSTLKAISVGSALTLALALPGAAPAPAKQRPAKRTICRDQTALRYSPGGPETGRLQRGDRVIVVDHARKRRWAYVLSRRGNGWIVTRAFCR